MGPVLESANVFSANETFPPMIQITLNGQTESLPATTSVLGLLENRALAGKRVAVERNGEDGLDFYLLSGNSANLPAWLLPAKASHINRAVAVYRHLAGIPSEAEPPAAP